MLLSLPDSTAVEQVVLGDDGLLANARARQVVVDLTTAAPSSSVKIHAALARREVAFVDAGISGGAAAAEQGTLTIMAGGAREALEIVAPILATFSARVYHMGEPGSGHVAKLLNNFLNATSLAATAEVMVAAKQSGLDLAQFLDVVNHSSGVNFATLNRFPRIIEGDYLEGGLTQRADGQGRAPLPRARAGDRDTEPDRRGVPRRVRARRGARLRRPDQQSRGRRDRRHRRRRPRPAGSEDKPMRIAKGRAGAPSEERGPTFTGRVWADPVLGAGDGIMVANVFFEPGSRTHWHTHEVAQVLHVIAGEGRVQSRDGTGWTLEAGDTVHIPAGEEHWHGGAPSSFLLHMAVSIGATDWLDPVGDDDYAAATGSR